MTFSREQVQEGVAVPLDETTTIIVVPAVTQVTVKGRCFDAGSTFLLPAALSALNQWWDIDDDPTQAAIDGIVKIVNALKAEFPSMKLVGHRDLPRAKGDTECPGEDLYKLLGIVRAETGLTGP